MEESAELPHGKRFCPWQDLFLRYLANRVTEEIEVRLLPVLLPDREDSASVEFQADLQALNCVRSSRDPAWKRENGNWCLRVELPSKRSSGVMLKILVGVDLAEGCSAALDFALQFAQLARASVRVVYAMPPTLWSSGFLDPSFVAVDWGPEMEHSLFQFVQTRRKETNTLTVQVETQVLRGFEHQSLLSETAASGASLIVLGCHRYSRLERMLLGSVASKVLRQAQVPVLIISGSAKIPGKILAAVELGQSTETVLKTAQAWRKLLGAQLDLAHVIGTTEPWLPGQTNDPEVQMEHWVQREEIRKNIMLEVQKVFPASSEPPLILLEGSAYLELCRHVQAEGYDLLIVGAHEKQGAFDLGDTTMRIAHQCPCPLLVARTLPEPPESF